MVGASGVLDSPRTKDQIIATLSEEWPLTAKEIYNRLQRKYSFTRSYQAAHKMVQLMCSENMLSKNEHKFTLNKEWLKKFGDYLKTLESSQGKDNNGIETLTFNTYNELAKFLVNEFTLNPKRYPNPENKDCMCKWHHAWPIIGMSDTEHLKLKKAFSETTHYCVTESTTFLDRMTMDYVQKMGKKNIISKTFPAQIDTFVQGDYIMQVYFPKEFLEEMEQVFKKTKSEKELSVADLIEFGSKSHKIKATIFKNQELADTLKEEARKLYKESRGEQASD